MCADFPPRSDATMRSEFEVRCFATHEWRDYRCLRLEALADSPDAFRTTSAEALERTDADWAGQLAGGVESPVDLPLVALRRGAMAVMTPSSSPLVCQLTRSPQTMVPRLRRATQRCRAPAASSTSIDLP